MATEQDVRVPWEPLKQFTAQVFVRCNLPPPDAEIVADALVEANLRGVDSHGVLRIPQYVEDIKKGGSNPTPRIETVVETPALAVLEADHAFGQVVCTQAMRLALAKAQHMGIGWVHVRGSAHTGALYYYPMMAVRQDMVGITATSTGPVIAPFGALARAVGNNPVAIAAPAKSQRPLVLDMALSVVAQGKIRHAAQKGAPIPQGWALDRDGDPTTDAAAALRGMLLPAGGYKGSGLSMMTEVLSSFLSMNPLISPAVSGPRDRFDRRAGSNSIVAALDIATFTSVDKFKEEVDRLILSVKALPKAPGVPEVYVPGELEWNNMEERRRLGIPLHPNILRNLRKVAQELEVEFPFEVPETA
ncbi:MAG: Ldh family oxidoreductase [Chloroflexi bacterium]|nr:Ldh family oxidoreductase [Chloroflexota bacterium]